MKKEILYSDDLKNNLLSGEFEFSDAKFNIDISTIIHTSEISHTEITFKNCEFNNYEITFSDFKDMQEIKHIRLNFNNCTFNNEIRFYNTNNYTIFINNSKLKKIILYKTDEIDIIISNNSNIEILQIDEVKKINELKINNSKINKLYFTNVNISNKFIIFENEINQIDFIRFNSNCEFDFIDNKILTKTEFSECNFDKISFKKNKFIGKLAFYKIEFNKSTVIDIDCKSNAYFNACKFNKYTHFDNSKFKNLEMNYCKFNEFTSLQNVECECIKLNKVTFENLAFFDDIKIIKLNECDRKTIRTIKQQLLKTDNKIDYNIFRSAELKAHYNKLKKENKKWYNNQNAFILMFGKCYSNFGINWVRPVKLTIIFSFLFYSIFFWVEYNKFDIGNFSLETNNLKTFFSGYLKFLIPTNLYNPLKNEKIYVDNFSWFPFILGKIIIAIGIYEIITAFRKYKKQ